MVVSGILDFPADAVNVATSGGQEGENTGWFGSIGQEQLTDVNPFDESIAGEVFGGTTARERAGNPEPSQDKFFENALDSIPRQFDDSPGGGFVDVGGSSVANLPNAANNAIVGALTSKAGLLILGLLALFLLGDDFLRSRGGS